MAAGLRRKTPGREISVNLPIELAARFERHISSQETRRRVYGLRSQVITELVRNWCDARDRAILNSNSTPKLEEVLQ